MPERGMTQVVGEASRLHYLNVNPEFLRELRIGIDAILSEPSPNLGHLIRVLLPGMEHIGFAYSNDLGDAGETMQRGRILNPIAVDLKRFPLVFFRCAVEALPPSRIRPYTRYHSRFRQPAKFCPA